MIKKQAAANALLREPCSHVLSRCPLLLRSSIARRGEAAHFSGMLRLPDKGTSGVAAFGSARALTQINDGAG